MNNLGEKEYYEYSYRKKLTTDEQIKIRFV